MYRSAEDFVGKVTHYYDHIGVAIVKCSKSIPMKSHLHFLGKTTDFDEDVLSMEFDHKPINTALQGQEVGIKVVRKVREGDEVYQLAA